LDEPQFNKLFQTTIFSKTVLFEEKLKRTTAGYSCDLNLQISTILVIVTS